MTNEKTRAEAEAPRRIAILGASGSVGRSALEVIDGSGGRLVASVLTVHTRTDVLAELVRRYHPEVVVVTNPKADRSPLAALPSGTVVLWGPEAVEEVVTRPDLDVVLSAIVGAAGLSGTFSALKAGKTVALANKESLVVAGELLMALVRSGRGKLIPVDSEHSAIYQCLHAHRRETWRESGFTGWSCPVPLSSDVARIILTASGGPFRGWSGEARRQVTAAAALRHPTWSMGPKITIDSATMINKALEIVEAHWLFDMPVGKITVLLHPQSVVHSMVEFVDGAILAQLSPPDMKLPIQFALYDSWRFAGPSRKMDWTQPFSLEFMPLSSQERPAVDLGMEVARRGGTAGVVFNTANEVAVHAFLGGRLPFDRIVPACQHVLSIHPYNAHPDLDLLRQLESWTRLETQKWICS